MIELPALYNTIIGGLIVAVITGISGLVWSLIKRRAAIKRWKEEEIVKGISELGDDRFKLVKSSKFIPTMGQIDKGPHDSDIITRSNSSFDLVDKLLKDIFSPDEGTWKRRFAILGGTGMGKSTFSAYLFYKYINYYKYKECKYPICIKYLGQKDVMSDLRKMSEKNDVSQSILILDALDENRDAANDTKAFLEEIEEITDKYRMVILTSRTQFFPNKESEPTKGNVIQNSHSNRFLFWERIYISPFDKEETQRYLETKFKVPSKEYSKAIIIADLSNDLMMRPMILSYVDYLLDLADNKIIMVSEIYVRIIDKWLSDECEGQALGKSDLFAFSKNLSFYIYEKWKQSGDSYVTEEEFQNFLSQNNYQDIPYSFRGRSLVNRRGDGSVKFSHKSIWEFFLAINSIENPGKSFKPKVFDAAENFSKELYQLYLNGKAILGINYCTPIIFDQVDNFFTIDNKLEEGKKNIYNSSLTDSEKDTLLRKLLFYYWGMSIRRLAYQYKKMPYKQWEHNSKGEMISHGEKLTEPIDLFLSKLQDCFLSLHKLNYRDLFSKMEDCQQSIHLYAQLPILNGQDFGRYGKSTKPIANDFVTFPSFFSENLLNNYLSHNYINIGIGFSEDKRIYEIIEKCTKNHDLDIVCVYRDNNNLDSHVNFICGLSTYLTELSSCIIVIINIDTLVLYYAINKLTRMYNSEQVRLCLSNMLSVNSLIQNNIEKTS